MAIQLIGTDTAGDTGSIAAYLQSSEFICGASGNCTSILVYCLVNSNVRVALFGDGGSHTMGDLIVESGSEAIVAGDWRAITIASTPLVKDTVYWLAFQCQTAGGVAFRALPNTRYRGYKAQAYGAFPADGTDFAYDDDYEYSLQGWGDISLVQKSLTGTLTPSGAIGIKTKVSRAGTLDLAGAVIAGFFKSLAGTLNLTGVVTSVYRQVASLAGTLTPSGELNRKISKAVSGTLTPSGALSTVKKIFASLSGTLNLSGAVLLKVLISLIGSLGLSGVISFLINLVGAGAVSVDGSLAHGYFTLSKFTASYTGLMYQIRVYANTSGNVKVAIYSDNGGKPDTLLSVVNASTAVTAGWNKITAPTISINQGTDYWLGFISE